MSSLSFQIEDPYIDPRKTWRICHLPADKMSLHYDQSVFIQSFLGILNLKQVTGSGISSTPLLFQLPVFSVADHDTEVKVVQLAKKNVTKPNVCDDNLCFNGAKCDPVTGEKCKCLGHFIGKYQRIIPGYLLVSNY